MRDFKQAYELAPAGSADEAGLQRDVRDAEVKLKKSKMKVSWVLSRSFVYSCGKWY